jgi:carbon storage regulator
MLVLARRKEQSIMIGDDIEVVIVDISNEQVKLGIVAPKHITVHRKEVYMSIREENIAAGKKDKVDLDELARLIKNKKTKD